MLLDRLEQPPFVDPPEQRGFDPVFGLLHWCRISVRRG